MTSETDTPAPPPRLALWVRGVDLVALLFGLLGVFVLLFGGFAITLGGPLRVHSPSRLFFVAASIVALRHVFVPADPLHRRVSRAIADTRAGALVPLALAVLASRLAVLAVGYFATITIGFPGKPPEVLPEPALHLEDRWDAGWYTGIALEGYTFRGQFTSQQNIAFFPAYPALMRVVGYGVAAYSPGAWRDTRLARLSWAGALVSLAAFVWAARYFWRLARDQIGEERAAYATALLAAYPFSVFYSAAYTESLFLLGVVAAFYHCSRREFGRATLWGLLVGLTRPNGCFLSLALAVAVGTDLMKRPRGSDRVEPQELLRLSLAVAAPVIGMLAFSAYVHQVTGSWFGWARLHEAWGRTYEGLAPATRAFTWLSEDGLLHIVERVPFDTLNSLGLLFALAMIWPVLRRTGLAYAVFVVINLIPPFVAGGVLSMGRFTATLFPLFIALAALVPRRAQPAVLTIFALGQGLAACLFFTWRQLF